MYDPNHINNGLLTGYQTGYQAGHPTAEQLIAAYNAAGCPVSAYNFSGYPFSAYNTGGPAYQAGGGAGCNSGTAAPGSYPFVIGNAGSTACGPTYPGTGPTSSILHYPTCPLPAPTCNNPLVATDYIAEATTAGNPATAHTGKPGTSQNAPMFGHFARPNGTVWNSGVPMLGNMPLVPAMQPMRLPGMQEAPPTLNVESSRNSSALLALNKDAWKAASRMIGIKIRYMRMIMTLCNRQPYHSNRIYEALVIEHYSIIHRDYLPLKDLDSQAAPIVPLNKWLKQITAEDPTRVLSPTEVMQLADARQIHDLPDAKELDAYARISHFIQQLYPLTSSYKLEDATYSSCTESARRLISFLFYIGLSLNNVNHAMALQCDFPKQLFEFLYYRLPQQNLLMNSKMIRILRTNEELYGPYNNTDEPQRLQPKTTTIDKDAYILHSYHKHPPQAPTKCGGSLTGGFNKDNKPDEHGLSLMSALCGSNRTRYRDQMLHMPLSMQQEMRYIDSLLKDAYQSAQERMRIIETYNTPADGILDRLKRMPSLTRKFTADDGPPQLQPEESVKQ